MNVAGRLKPPRFSELVPIKMVVLVKMKLGKALDFISILYVNNSWNEAFF